MNRRTFLSLAAGISFLPFVPSTRALASDELQFTDSDKEASTRYIFAQIMKQAVKEKWQTLPIGECMGRIGLLLLGTQYVGGTLEAPGAEACRVDLTGLDCVTFFEDVLDMARILKKGNIDYEDLMNEITYTRYRDGRLTDYTSRLHYTADWIFNNGQKGVVKDITKDIGGIPFPLKVSFMSAHPQYYPALQQTPPFVATMAGIEESINARSYFYIPQDAIKDAEDHLQTGDIIAIATDKEGLDYSHTGMVYRDPKTTKIRFLHASLKKKKVVLDTELYQYVKTVKSNIGITIARPQEVG